MRQKPTSLSGLPAKKLTTGQRKLQEFGITPDRWIAMLGADDASMQKMADAWPLPGVVYSAAQVGKLLGIKTESVPAPPAVPGRYIVYLPPEIAADLAALRGTKAPMWEQDWYDGRYSTEGGYYEADVPLFGSNRMANSQQSELVTESRLGFNRTPVNVDATLWAVHKLATDEDLFKGDYIRCPEESPHGYRVGLYEDDGRLDVNRWNSGENRLGDVWASAARRLAS